jgi:hypothetical protein
MEVCLSLPSLLNVRSATVFASAVVCRRLYTKPFHGGNTGSIPVGRTNDFNDLCDIASPKATLYLTFA